MEITVNEVEHVAKLSKFEIAADIIEQVSLQLSAVIDYMRPLQEVDICGIEPTTHVLQLTNAFREDERLPCLPQEQALALAPEREGGFFKAPSIL